MLDILTKSKKSWSGRRKGAGRPRDPASIRSEVAKIETGFYNWQAVEETGCSHYELWRFRYITDQAIRPLQILSFFCDKDIPHARQRRKTYISQASALKLAHNDPETQLEFLLVFHRTAIEKFLRQRKDWHTESGTKLVEYMRRLLRIPLSRNGNRRLEAIRKTEKQRETAKEK